MGEARRELSFVAARAMLPGCPRPRCTCYFHTLLHYDRHRAFGALHSCMVICNGVLVPPNPFIDPPIYFAGWEAQLSACFNLHLRVCRAFWVTPAYRFVQFIGAGCGLVVCLTDASHPTGVCVASRDAVTGESGASFVAPGDMLMVMHANNSSVLFGAFENARFSAVCFVVSHRLTYSDSDDDGFSSSDEGSYSPAAMEQDLGYV